MKKHSKLKTPSITKAPDNLRTIVESVGTTNKHAAPKKAGVPVTTIVSCEELEDVQDALDLIAARKKERSVPIHKLANALKSLNKLV